MSHVPSRAAVHTLRLEPKVVDYTRKLRPEPRPHSLTSRSVGFTGESTSPIFPFGTLVVWLLTEFALEWFRDPSEPSTLGVI